ncbi:MAG: methionyl-tRNA formyltransferase [Thermomicrobia bacterium]|nr:methionyl-tRNA formyltransferase [Thermomicrobia bacterium]
MVVPRPDAPVPVPVPVVFFGSPPFAVPTLLALAGDGRVAVRLVVTQPPRPSGRGRQVHRSAVHAAAEDRGLTVATPERLRDPAVVAMLSATTPSLFVVAAYGKILRPEILALPDRGTLNVHASLLPAYRGASPIHAALLDGAAETGVSIMLMDVGLDTGPVLAQARMPISADATTESLSASLADLGAPLLVKAAARWVRSELLPVPQDDNAATMTHLIKKDNGNVRWAWPAVRIAQMERAYRPWPGVFTFLTDKRLLLHGLRALPAAAVSAPLGTIVAVDNDGLRVRTGEGDLLIARVQPEGKSPVAAIVYAHGHPAIIGLRLTMGSDED